MNRKYTKSNVTNKSIAILICAISILLLYILKNLTVYAFSTDNTKEAIILSEPADIDVNTTYNLGSLPNMLGGVALLLEGHQDYTLENYVSNQTYKLDYIDGFDEPQYIRCTGYCDYGYTKSGQYTRHGIVAGKEEWLGKTCYIYQVAEDGSCGELIGIYEFLDTGYGINGSSIKGTSIDVWFPSEDAVWDWMKTYGDYVYIQILDAVG